MTRLKINYTMSGTGLTGGSRVLLEIANHLVDRGHHVTITSLGNEEDHKWFPLKAEISYVKMPRTREAINCALKRLAKAIPDCYLDIYPHDILKELTKAIPDCDINVATFCFTAFSVFESNRGVPFYHMQHYEPLFFDDQRLKKLAEETYYLPLNKIANSIWLKNQMKERYGYDVPIVNPAIDHNIFYPREVKKSSSKFGILCFAKETRWKGFPEALEAMRIVMSKRNDVEFVAYGMAQPTYKSAVPYTFIRGPPDDELARLYSSADIVICPSWYESFPLFPLEAMACGTPIITTPFGTEDYAFHEKNCLIVQPQEPKSLADAVIRLLEHENLRVEFSKEGSRTAKQFTWNRTVDEVERLFKEVSGHNLC
ncbi:glycosyltransferase family 4 protein [Candidatus Bathyarchaeota archaeon]|nr:glycosyltransferase family 4 protein [Candidatus Bathyarchaeota archaeon]